MKLDGLGQPDSEAANELNRLLEVGKLLASVLTEEELATLHILIGGPDKEHAKEIKNQKWIKIGNASVT